MSARVNICFHGVGTLAREREPGERDYWISEDVLRGVLDLAVDHPEIRLSVDDGNVSDVEKILPSLTERGLTATFFVLAGRLGTSGSLSADDVRTLRAAGMRIGSHGMDHLPWPSCGDAALARELGEARDVLAEISGQAITDAACPLGRYDRRVLRALRMQGYGWVGTSDRRPARDAGWLQPRFSVRAADTVTSFAEEVLGPVGLPRRATRSVKGLVKRLR